MTDLKIEMLDVNGERIAVRRVGAGPVLMFLHGLGGGGAGWDGVAAALADGFETWAFDLRGHGASSAQGPFSIAGCVADTIAAADALGLATFHLVGEGMGATIAGKIAATSPARVRSLALVAARLAPGPEAADEVYAVREALHYLTPDDFGLQFAESMLPPEAPAALIASVAASVAKVPKAVLMKAIEETAAVGLALDAARIVAPTLIVSGRQDERASPDEGERLARAIAGARATVIENAGHLIAGENPNELAGALRAFLGPLRLAEPIAPR